MAPPFVSRFFRQPMLWAWIIVSIIAWILGSYSFGDTDQGFIQGLAWRVFRGETVYLDFDYVRPPFSPWFHSVWFQLFGAGGGLLAGRMFMVFQLALAGWCQLEILGSGKGKGEKRNVWLFLAVFFLALHNFPAMPWHTIDGIFWGSIGLWLLHRESRVLFSGWILIGFAVFTKQSFYLLPVLTIIWLLMDSRHSLGKSLFQLLILVLLAAPMVYLTRDFWYEMLAWTTGVSSIYDLIQVGVIGYLLPLLPAAAIVGIKEWSKRSAKADLARWVYPAAVAAMAGIWLLKMLLTEESTPPLIRMAHILFWIAFWEAAKLVFQKDSRGYTWLLLLGLAWCSSLSWGYQTPILVAGPLLWILNEQEQGWYQKLLPVLPLFLISVAGFFYPYREILDFSSPSSAFSEAYPSLDYIHPGPEIRAELLELDSLRTIYPGRYSVLPNWPQIHVLTETDNPLRIDWAHNAEGRFETQLEAYMPGLMNCEVIFVDKDRIDKAEQDGKYGSLLLKGILNSWEEIAEGRQFVVLRKRPKKQ